MIPYTKPLALLFLGGLLSVAAMREPVAPVADVKLKLISDQFSHPTALAFMPTGAANRVFVCEQEGRIRVVDNGKLLLEPFLDISSEVIKRPGYDERGLLGLAFHPDFAKNGKFYLYCSTPVTGREGVNNVEQVREYTVDKATNGVDKTTMRVLLKMDDPDPSHNGR